MGFSRCRVSYTDGDGMNHTVIVDAESLYEAVALAVAGFRGDERAESALAPMTELRLMFSGARSNTASR
jgi:hypothetical protein